MSLEDKIRGLFPGVTDEHVARVVDVLAQGDTSPSPTGTSSAGGHGLPPSAPSTPTPQVGDRWLYAGDRLDHHATVTIEALMPEIDDLRYRYDSGHRQEWRLSTFGEDWRLIERGGEPWPPAQEPAGEDGVEPATDERPEVVPADDDDLTVVEDTNVPVRHQFDWNNWFVACLVARLRQEQARVEHISARLVTRRRERDEAVARAEAAEAAVARVERVTPLFMVPRNEWHYERRYRWGTR